MRRNVVTQFFHTAGLLALLVTGTLAGAAEARSDGTPIPNGTLKLLAETEWAAPGRTIYLGLHIRLDKGWHTYWVNPGDSGQPPRVTWQLSPGLTAGEIEWPAPKRMGTPRIVDFGYENEVTLLVPVQVSAELAAQPAVRLGAVVDVMVCADICVAGRAPVSLTLPVKAGPPPLNARHREIFTAARNALPQPAPANWRLRFTQTEDSIVLAAVAGERIAEATFFPFEDSQIDNPSPQQLEATADGFRLTLKKSRRLRQPLDRLRGVLVLGSGSAYSVDVPARSSGAVMFGFQFPDSHSSER